MNFQPPPASALWAHADGAIGSFFLEQYAGNLPVNESTRVRCLGELSAESRQRVLAQAKAHWSHPSLTHYAIHSLQHFEQRLPFYQVALEHRFGVGAWQVLQGIRQAVMMVQKAGSTPPQVVVLAGVDSVPPEFLEALIQPLLDRLRVNMDAFDVSRPNSALAAWLDSLPELIGEQVFSTPQARADAAKQDAMTTLRKAVLGILCDLLPKSVCYSDVFYPVSVDGQTRYAPITGLISWQDHLIVVDTDGESESVLAATADFDSYLHHLEWLRSRPMPCLDFRRYFESASSVALYTPAAEHRYEQRIRLSSRQFSRVLHLSVTLDDVLALIRRLQPASQPDQYRSLSVSLHELMTYQDVLTQPATLLWFLRQRTHALSNPHLGWLAELDHLNLNHHLHDYADALDTVCRIQGLVSLVGQSGFAEGWVQGLRDRWAEMARPLAKK